MKGIPRIRENPAGIKPILQSSRWRKISQGLRRDRIKNNLTGLFTSTVRLKQQKVNQPTSSFKCNNSDVLYMERILPRDAAMHSIQTPLTHLQSPHNHPTSISA